MSEIWVVVDDRFHVPLAVFRSEDKALDFMMDFIEKFHYNENDIYIGNTDFHN